MGRSWLHVHILSIPSAAAARKITQLDKERHIRRRDNHRYCRPSPMPGISCHCTKLEYVWNFGLGESRRSRPESPVRYSIGVAGIMSFPQSVALTMLGIVVISRPALFHQSPVPGASPPLTWGVLHVHSTSCAAVHQSSNSGLLAHSNVNIQDILGGAGISRGLNL